MSNYVKATDFASKDALTTGNPLKLIKGTEINDELNAIQTAVATKADLASPAFTGNPTAATQASGNSTTRLATTAFVQQEITASEASASITSGTIANVAITGGTISGLTTDLAVADGGTGASTLAANAVLLGNGTSAVQTVAPSTSGNVLKSNGTTWTSAAENPSIGVGQTWQNLTSSRAYATTYTNSTGNPIYISVRGTSNTATGGAIQLSVDGVVIARQGVHNTTSAVSEHTITSVVPNGSTYNVSVIPPASGTGGSTLVTWFELR